MIEHVITGTAYGELERPATSRCFACVDTSNCVEKRRAMSRNTFDRFER